MSKIDHHQILCDLGRELQALREENERLRELLQLAFDWLDEVCNPHNEQLRTDEGVEVYNKIQTALKGE